MDECSNILAGGRAPKWVPLRVDFAGGWLDVPAYAREGGRIVNCAITPGLSLRNNWIAPGSGLGGSAAWALLTGKNPIESELSAGVGWQDPACLLETGLCVWESGPRPRLEMRDCGEWLCGLMALRRAGETHTTADHVGTPRDLDGIAYAGTDAAAAVRGRSVDALAHAIQISSRIQRAEGMEPLPTFGELASKYCGAGWGGYALYLFAVRADRAAFVASGDGIAVEPFDRWQVGV